MKAQTLSEYIEKHYNGSRVKFARCQCPQVSKQIVNQWLSNGYIVVNGTMYSKRRTIK